LNDAFLSVVADKNDPNKLMIRARRKEDLRNIVGEQAQILETVTADYRWRTFLTRERFKELISQRIDRIDYTNFKNSVTDDERHEMYSDFWGIHRRYQQRDRSLRRGADDRT
jgi:hypothetical protein